MFIQIIQGHVADPAQIRQSFEEWTRELSAGAEGWLGTTAGVTDDGELIAIVRFESADAAERNSHRPEQHQWWMETAKLFAGDATFNDCRQVGTFLAGGSDEAGFVQVMQGRTSDSQRLWELNRRTEPMLKQFRPEIIGGTAAAHDSDQGAVTQVVYFTSEAAAREGEGKTPPPELTELFDAEQDLFADLRYYDLHQPWTYSPER
jgi:hypothetical protein